MRRTFAIPILAAAVAVVFFLFSDPFMAPPDCAFYWAWADALTHSLSFDFGPALERLEVPARYCYITATGRLANDWPMGTGLTLLPAAWAGLTWAHAWVLLLTAAATGFWWRLHVKRWISGTAAVAAMVFGTPLMFYAMFGPFFSHDVSFAVVTLFLATWAHDTPARTRQLLLLGILLGLATLIRPQNILMGVALLPDAVHALRRDGWVPLIKRFTVPLMAGLIVGLAPRFPAYGVIYGNLLALPKLDEMHWLAPALGKVLLSDYHGILPWTPVYALAIVGLFLALRTRRTLAAGLLLVLAVQIYVNAANEVWWSGGSFGNRRLVDYAIVVAWGIWLLIEAMPRRFTWAAIALTAICCTWTLTLALAERRLIVPLDRYVPFRGSAFWHGLLRVYSEPGATLQSAARALPGHEAARGIAAIVLAAALTSVGYWLSRTRADRVLETLLRVAGVFSAAGLILCTVAAFRTPPQKSSSLVENLPSSSTILWDNYIELAGYHLVRQENPEAIRAGDKAITVLPDASAGYWLRGIGHLQAGQEKLAIADFRQVLKLQPDHRGAAEALASMNATREDLSAAQEPTPAAPSDWRVKN